MTKATVVANRKLSLVFVITTLCLCISLHRKVSTHTVQVFRRFSFDIYILSSDLVSNENCDPTLNSTYLVTERECVSNQELFSSM